MGQEYIKKLIETGKRKKGGIIKELDPECLNALNFFIDNLNSKYKVKLVISSTWRVDMQQTIETLKTCGLKYNKEITGTGVIDHVRGFEILDYLKDKQNNRNYVVIDDDLFDIEPYIPKTKIIRTSIFAPLNLSHVKKHLSLLNILTNKQEEKDGQSFMKF